MCFIGNEESERYAFDFDEAEAELGDGGAVDHDAAAFDFNEDEFGNADADVDGDANVDDSGSAADNAEKDYPDEVDTRPNFVNILISKFVAQTRTTKQTKRRLAWGVEGGGPPTPPGQ